MDTPSPETPIPAKPRRGWFRFSLRSLLLFSLCAGAGPLLYFKLPAWRLDCVIDTTECTAPGREYKVGKLTLYEDDGRRMTVYRGDIAACSFDFFTTQSRKPDTKGWQYFDECHISREPSPDLSKLLLADECHALLYDIEKCKKVHEWTLVPDNLEKLPEYFQYAYAYFSPDSSRIAIICQQRGEIVVLNAVSGGIVLRIPIGSRDVRALSFSPDCKNLLIEGRASLVILALDGSGETEMKREANYWRANAAFYAPDSTQPEGALLALGRKNEIDIFRLRDNALLRTTKPEGESNHTQFEGFSPNGHYFMTTKSHMDLGSKRVMTLHETLSGKELMSCWYTDEFETQGSDSSSRAMASAAGNLCVVSNPAGDVRLWRIDSHDYLGEITPRKMTRLPAAKPGYDGPMIVTCMPRSRYAHHSISVPANSPTADGIFVHGIHSPRHINEGERERDYILRRNHPDGWYGVLCLVEFWLAAAVFVGLGWSLVRDWRELRTNV